MRTGKTSVFGTTINNYNYVYEGGLLLQMTRNNYTYDFSYDANGTPIGFKYTSPSGAVSLFYYGVNSRGDIVAVYNFAGTKIATYSYDAYGKPLTTTHHVSGYTTAVNNNPLRYRGYVYDNDTGFYYLQSRYYDPTTCRFINEDGYCSTGQGITGNNMYAYCNNNPVIFSDPTGTLFAEHGSCGWGGSYSGSGFSGGGSYSSSASAVTSTLVTTVIVAGGATAAYNDLRREMFFIKALERTFISSASSSSTKTKSSSDTVVYRYGGTNPGNFVPSERDVNSNSGLSFMTTPPRPGAHAAVTTLEALNETGIVKAYIDKPGHVRVDPVVGTLEEWRAMGSSHPCTVAIKSIVVKWDGKY